MGTRFDIEVCRHFHPDLFAARWLEEGKELSRELANDSADGLQKILAHVRSGAPEGSDEALSLTLVPGLRAKEASIGRRAVDLALTLQNAVGRGSPLTEIGDRVATPLQAQLRAVGA
jgi:hypothetical protein